jgi:hypothetical protein
MFASSSSSSSSSSLYTDCPTEPREIDFQAFEDDLSIVFQNYTSYFTESDPSSTPGTPSFEAVKLHTKHQASYAAIRDRHKADSQRVYNDERVDRLNGKESYGASVLVGT